MIYKINFFGKIILTYLVLNFIKIKKSISFETQNLYSNILIA